MYEDKIIKIEIMSIYIALFPNTMHCRISPLSYTSNIKTILS